MSAKGIAFELLCEALEKDPEICEVGKTFFQSELVSSYPGHRVAVSASVLPDLYVHAHRSLFELKSRRYRLDNKDTPPHVVKAFEKLSRVVVLFNSECATAWNIRKELLESNRTDLLVERHLCDVVLRSFPKSRETFVHRRWLVRNATQSLKACQDVCGMSLTELLEQERRVCQWCAELARHNYQAWNHRVWVLRLLIECDSSCNIMDVVKVDLIDTALWLESHVSDYSGLHHRYCVMMYVTISFQSSRTLGWEEVVIDLLTSDLDKLSGLIRFFPGHQTLWYYRRAVVYLLVHCLADTSSDQICLDSPSRLNCVTLLKNEDTFSKEICKQSSEGIEDFKQSELAALHSKWLHIAKNLGASATD